MWHGILDQLAFPVGGATRQDTTKIETKLSVKTKTDFIVYLLLYFALPG